MENDYIIIKAMSRNNNAELIDRGKIHCKRKPSSVMYKEAEGFCGLQPNITAI